MPRSYRPPLAPRAGMTYDLSTPEGLAAWRKRLHRRPRVCPGSGQRIAAPAMTTAPDERCPRCERYVRPIKCYGDWQLASHAPLGAISQVQA